MKPSIFIVIIYLFLFLNAAGQKTNEYKFVYKFQLDDENDSSKMIVDTLQNQSDIATLDGIILNNKFKPASFLMINLKGKDTTIWTTTNEKGRFEIKVKPSIYNLTFTGVGYKTLTTFIHVEKQKGYSFKITLATGNSLTWYDINSKNELTQKEIDEIKKCVQICGQNVIKCRKKNEYYVTIEI